MQMATGGNMETRSRQTGRLIVVVAFLAAGTGFAVWFGPRFWELATFASVRESGLKSIEDLRRKRPPEVSDRCWQVAINWTRTAYLNIFSSVDDTTSMNLRLVVKDLERISERQTGLQTVEEMWELLAQSGPRGRQYVNKFYPELQRSCMLADAVEGDRARGH